MFLSQNIHRSAKSQEETNVTQWTGHLLYTGNREQVMVTHFICISMAWLKMNFSAKYSSPLSKINFKTCHSLLQNKYKLIELLTYFLLCYMHMYPLELQWKSLVLKVWTRVKKKPRERLESNTYCIFRVGVLNLKKKIPFLQLKTKQRK